ncbi:histidine kinase [Streptomyces sp. NPDC049881]|uniref:sensor histidine kinase n=1 Tax=Streptomyces sp. NPDC049881 TaxID=3155778 RepID=UPI00343245E2
MLLTWVGRAVGERFGPARFVPLLIGPGYLLFMQRTPVTPADWAVTLAAAGLFLAGGRWPLAVTVAESALIVAAHGTAASTPVVAKVLASVALFELAVRRPYRTALIGMLAVTVAYVVVLDQHETVGGVLAVGYRVLCVVGAPLLLGAYLRASRDALAQARARAREAEERRELAAEGARLAERTELARELHDLVAHHVASMALRAGVAREVLPGLTPPVREVLDDIHSAATATLADLRRMVAVLRDPAALQDAGRAGSLLVAPAELPAAVTAVVERSAQAGLRVEPRIDPGLDTLDAVRGLAVLRVVQEGLTNVAKHAGAGTRTLVAVTLAHPAPAPVSAPTACGADTGTGRPDCTDRTVRVEVTDEGPAGPPAARLALPAASTGGGYGLVGLRERVALFGGTLSAGPVPRGPGWRLRAEFPAPRVPRETP